MLRNRRRSSEVPAVTELGLGSAIGPTTPTRPQPAPASAASVASVADETEPLFLRVPPGLKRKLRVAAARKGISMTAHAIVLLGEALAFEHLAERVLEPDPDLAP